MDNHLSPLQLDELAAGLTSTPEATAHAQACPACTEQLAVRKRDREAFFAQPGVQSRKAVFLAATQEAPPARQFRWWLALVPAGAALALLLVVPLRAPRSTEGDVVSLKGSFSVTHRGEVRVGSLVELVVSNPSPAFINVVVIGDRGARALLWPTQPEATGQVEAGAAVPLSPAFEVTPGDMWIVALRSAQRLEAAKAVAAVTANADGGTPTVRGRGLEASAEFLKVSAP